MKAIQRFARSAFPLTAAAVMALFSGACDSVAPSASAGDGTALETEGPTAPEVQQRLDAQEAAAMRLQELHDGGRGRSLDVRYEERTGVPGFIRCDIRLQGFEGDPAGHSLELMRELSPLFGDIDADRDLAVAAVQTDELGATHVHLVQRVDGVRVHGGELKVHLGRDGAITSLGGSLIPGLVPEAPQLGEQEAVDVARARLRTLDGFDARLAATDGDEIQIERVLFQPSLYGGEDTTVYTAWAVRIAGAEVLVDAVDGNVVQTLDRWPNGMVRTVNDASALMALVYLEHSPFNGLTCSGDCDDVVDHMETVHDYWMDEHGRDSYDGAGAILASVVHDNMLGDNAWADGNSTHYSDDHLSQDTVVHEWTHNLTMATADMIYLNEPGALHEHFSDIFAAYLDGDWAHGDDLPGHSTANPVRDLADPNRGAFDPSQPPGGGNEGRPDHMDDFLTIADTLCNSTGDINNGCVHFNCTIPSHGIFLASEGGTKSGIEVDGVGLQAIEPVLWRTLVTKLTASSDFDDYRDEMLESCGELYGLQDAICASIQNGLAAVGIGDPVTEDVSSGSQLGAAVASADLDGDGIGDVVAGAPFHPVDGASDSGSVFVYVSDGSTVSGGDARMLRQSQFGGAIEPDDLIVGAPYEDYIQHKDAGLVVVHYGSSIGVDDAEAIWQSNNGESSEAGDRFGFGLAVGDVIGGDSGLVIGAPGEDTEMGSDAGAVRLRPVSIWATPIDIH